MSFISYAQNFEDVMLWRALGHIEHGFYIDIGAQDPIIDSVSLAFHEHGWRGIHVEPTPHYAELLRQQRPGDTVIQAAVGKGQSKLRFFEIPDTGISTADPAIAKQHRERGFDVHEITVPCIALSAVFKTCAGSEIHWLKIDVEGFEKQVLSSWGKSASRPWIVVVESTLPMTQIETHESWEAILIGYGYTSIYFDGLNRFYISDAHPELKDAFRAPPNLFDGFYLNGTSSIPYHHLIESRYKQQISEAIVQNEQQKLSADNEIERLTLSLSASDKTHAEQEQKRTQREQEVAAQLLAIQQQAAQEMSELARSHSEQERELHRQHTEREQTLAQQLQAGQEELRRLEQDRAQREKDHAEQTMRVQQDMGTLLRAQAQREQEVDAQLLSIQQKTHQEMAEQARSHSEQERALQRHHAEREQALSQQLQAAQQGLFHLEQDRGQHEKEHAEQTMRVQQELECLLRTQAQREQEVAAQLLAIQQQAAQEMAQQARSYNEKELALRREQALHHQLQQTLNTLHRELITMRNDLSWRLTSPLRTVAGWFKSIPIQTGYENSAAKQLIVESMSYPEIETTTTVTTKFTSNISFLENHNINSDSSLQATQPNPSSEAQNLKALLQYQDRQFIEYAYLTLLKRKPDNEGLNYYLNRLRSGVPKIHILGQMLKSHEARANTIELPGLRYAIKLHKLAQLPLVGSILKSFIKIEGNSAFESRLRAVEQHIFLWEKQSNARFEHFNHGVNNSQQLVAQQGQQLLATVQQHQQLLASIQQRLAAITPGMSVIEPIAGLIQSEVSGDFSHEHALKGHDLIKTEIDGRPSGVDDRRVVGRIAFDRGEVFSSALAAVKQWPLGKRVNE